MMSRRTIAICPVVAGNARCAAGMGEEVRCHRARPIMRDGKLVEKLQPRLEAAPEVLFARAPTLPAGDYQLHWTVRSMTGAAVTEGDIPFAVKDQP